MVSDPQQQPPASPPPGWYPDPQGVTRWWDGTAWGQAAPPAPQAPFAPTSPASVPVPTGGNGPWAVPQDERTLAVLAHVLCIFFGILGPLVIYLIARPEQRFAKHHSAEALNFSITVFIGLVVSALLILVLIGIVLFFVVVIGALVLNVVAAVAANRGEWYRYPINIRMVSGAVG